MSNSVSVSVSFTPLYNRLVETVGKALVEEAFVNAEQRISPIAQAAFIDKLPDGAITRLKQSEKSRVRFPNHMKQSVRIKRLKDSRGVASIIGTTTAVGQTHFDFGDKAKTSGRVHILWGQKPATPPNRVQRKELQDIPEQVANIVSAIAENIVIEEITAALSRVS